ncbi:MAG: peptidoglycan recognition family protein [Pseudoflavonifractor sp.]
MRGHHATRHFLHPALRLPAALLVLVLILLGVRALLTRPSREPGHPPVPEWVEEDLLPVSEYSRPGIPLDAVNGVVVHYTGNPGTTARQNRSYFSGLALSRETAASSNFIIGLDGEILLTVPLDEVAYCSNSRNSDTLSIEVCHPDDTGKFTDASYASLLKLVQWLCDTYHLDRSQVLRHYDIIGKDCPRYFVQNPDAWEGFLDQLTFGTH